MSAYEHLHVDISPEALEWIIKTLQLTADHATLSRSAYIEVQNFINECEARVQHAAARLLDMDTVGTEFDASDLL